MSVFHPGGAELTRKLIKCAGLSKGSRVLDVGCGEGRSMELLRTELELYVAGCDRNDAFLKLAKKRNPGASLRHTDGVSLDFPSTYFDGVLLECSFSLMDRHEELLHEMYCVLKPGGMLMISDLYLLDPDPLRVKAEAESARKYLSRERDRDGCVEDGQREPSPFRLDGAFVKDALIEGVKDAGFELVEFSDLTPELRSYTAQAIMDYGSLEKMLEALLPEGTESCDICGNEYSKNTGYFMLIAKKSAL